MAFSIALIIILGLASDYLFRRLRLPGLVGMLIVGILVGPYVFNMVSSDMMTSSGDFRKIALVVILLRAGFELRRDVMHRIGRAALIMSCLPAMFEIGGIILVAPRWLDLSYLDAAILGAILSAVSPAVVVPLMIEFMQNGRGSQKGIPTMILGASSLDDIFVIVLFTIFLGMATGTSASIGWQLTKIPVSVALGILIGLIPGFILFRLFTRFDWRPPKRTLVVLGVAIMLTWVESRLEDQLPVASLLGVMAIGFVILEKAEPVAHIISRKLSKLWVFSELLLFVLVGAQVNIRVAWEAGAAGLMVIAVGLVFRSLGTYLSLVGTPFSRREKLFCVVAYIPKATVQAAIGAVPLAAGLTSGEVILAVAVLSIVITAPLGAIGIAFLGERILDHGFRSPYHFKKLRGHLELPRVGERILHKKSGVVWKVIEEKEIWLHPDGISSDDESDGGVIAAIYQRYWVDKKNGKKGSGKTMERYYTWDNAPFHTNWEVLYDW